MTKHTITIHSKIEADDLLRAVESREKELNSFVKSAGSIGDNNSNMAKAKAELNRLGITKGKVKTAANKHYHRYDYESVGNFN